MSSDNNSSRVPTLRFPGFEGEWEEKTINEVFVRLTNKNKENNQNVLTISAQYGLISQLDFFKKSVASSDVTGYYLLRRGDFAYNKSSSQERPVGAIKPLKLYDDGVVSTLYICFQCKNKDEINFWEQYFDAGQLDSAIASVAQEGARNHGLLNIPTGDFFNLKVMCPSSSEMKMIADCLSTADDLIHKQERVVESVKQKKRGLMQQLFPQNGETTPQLRFAGFEGEWKGKKLGEVGTFVRGLSYSKADVIQDENGTLVIRSNNIVQDSSVDCKNGLQFVSKAPTDEQILKTGDIAICLSNGSSNLVGKSACYKGDYEGVATVGAFCGIYRSSAPIAKYLVQTQEYKKKINLIKQGGNGALANLYGRDIMDLEFDFPSIAEQKMIAECLLALDEVIASETEKLESLKTYKKGLMQNLFPQPVK